MHEQFVGKTMFSQKLNFLSINIYFGNNDFIISKEHNEYKTVTKTHIYR